MTYDVFDNDEALLVVVLLMILMMMTMVMTMYSDPNTLSWIWLLYI